MIDFFEELHFEYSTIKARRAVKKTIFAVLIAACLSAVNPALSTADSGDDVARGKAFFIKGLYFEAADEFRKAVEADPKDITARVYLGMAYYESGRFGPALDTFKKVVQLAPNDRRGYNYLGFIYMDLGLLDDAVAAYTRLTEIDPTNAVAAADLGAAYYKKGKINKSVDFFKKALSIRPFSPLALKNLGFIYSVEGKWPEAIDELVLARMVDAQYSDVEFMLRDFLDRARPFLDNWLKNSPDDPRPHYYIAYASAFKGGYFGEADWNIAMGEISKAVSLDPRNAKFCVARALILTLQMAFPQAIGVSKECVALDPGDWQAWKGLAEEELALGNAQDGLAAAEKAAEISPGVISVEENLGVAWSEKADDEKALNHFENAARLGARSGLLEYDLAVTYHNLKNFDMAWEHARLAQSLGYGDADRLIKELESVSKEPAVYP